LSLPRSTYLPFGKPNFSDQEIDAVTRVLRSGWIGMGPETIAFEQELAAAVGAPHVVTVNSCTSALFLALLVHDVGPGDEVICPSLTWCSTANAALHLGATPVFCDVDPDTLCVTPETVRAKLTPKTKAVVVVHFAGYAIDVAGLRATLPSHVAIVEDAAHAFGARFKNRQFVGSSGNLTCFSFYANKNLATGEGGAIALADTAMSERLRSLRQHGLPLDAWKRFTHPGTILLSNQLTALGYKMNYTDLQAALGRVQLRRQNEFAAIRLAIAQEYERGLAALQPSPRLQVECTSPNHARHLFTVRLPFERMKLTRDEVILKLRARNVGATLHYAALHQMPLYRQSEVSLPQTEAISRSIITLPISASMSIADATETMGHLAEVLG
jgi:perosamine synthetase